MQAEETALRNEEKFTYVFEHSPIGESITLPSGEIRVNAALCAMLGYTREELESRRWQDITHPDDIAATDKALEPLLAGKQESTRFIKRYVRKNGLVVWADVSTSLRRDENRRPLYFVTAISDVIARRHEQERLRESEERFRAIFDNATIGLYRTTPDGRILMANPALLQMLGCSSFEELVERNLEEEGFEPSYSRAEFINRIENEGGIRGLESAWRRQDGATLFVRESARAVPDDSGRVLYYEGSVEDITERKLAEEALRSLSVRQEVLLAAIPEIVMEVDTRKVYTWANRAGLDFFGDDVVGSEASRYFEGDQNTYEAVQPVFSGEEGTIYVESWQRRRDGQKRLLGWWCRTLKDGQGHVIGALSTASDITERRRAEDALRESEQKYRSFVERAGDGILIIQAGVVKYVNPELARMWGGEPDGIIGRLFTDFVGEADLALVAEHYRRRLAGEDIPHVYLATLVRRDGSGVPTELNSEVIEYDGRPADFVIIRDLTERREAEKKLKESEERLRLTLEATQIGIWDWDVKTDQWHVSPVYYSMLGYEPRPGLADRAEWLERVHPDDRARVQEEIQGVLSGHFLTYEYEARLRHADGTYHWVSVAGFNIKRDTDGKTTRILGTRMDITERKRAGEALRASEERYRRIAANIDGVLYSVDAETREFTYLSPAFERMLGYNEADVKEMGGRKKNFSAE